MYSREITNHLFIMCGITGFIHQNRIVEEEELRKMASAISYRGPDDEGFYLTVAGNWQIGMGFRRLAILDLSPRGHQPMEYEGIVLTLNGEIYNFREIREDLLALGYSFSSTGDAEVALPGSYVRTG